MGKGRCDWFTVCRNFVIRHCGAYWCDGAPLTLLDQPCGPHSLAGCPVHCLSLPSLVVEGGDDAAAGCVALVSEALRYAHASNAMHDSAMQYHALVSCHGAGSPAFIHAARVFAAICCAALRWLMSSPLALQASGPQPAMRVLPAAARVVGAVQGKREGDCCAGLALSAEPDGPHRRPVN